MEMKRKFQGIWIPAELWLTKDITMQEKLFLVEINSLDNDNGCFAGNKHFAKLFDISERRVTTVINSLEEKGFVQRSFIYKDGTKQIIKRVLNICSPPYPTKVLAPTEQMFEGGTEQKFRDNNTSINNTNNNTKELYLEFVKLSDDEFDKLVDKFGTNQTNDLIERLNNYIGSKGKKYKSHYHTILNWARKDNDKGTNVDVFDMV